MEVILLPAFNSVVLLNIIGRTFRVWIRLNPWNWMFHLVCEFWLFRFQRTRLGLWKWVLMLPSPSRSDHQHSWRPMFDFAMYLRFICRRRQLAQLGSASGVWKTLVKYLVGCPQVRSGLHPHFAFCFGSVIPSSSYVRVFLCVYSSTAQGVFLILKF
jgi:hypothetical protein